MAIQRTTTCHRHEHAEFRISYDPALVPVEDDVRWLIDWLEQSVAQGIRFTAGETCQVGWLVNEIKLGGDGSLSLWESDMKQMPIVWTESVSNTLAHLRLQKDVVESVLFDSDLSFPSMRQSAIICTRLGQSEDIVLERSTPSGTDSGWFFGCSAEDHDHSEVSELRCVSLFEAAVRYSPQIIPYLALPAGVLIAVSDGVPTIFRDGEPLAFKHGSYLAARHLDS